MRMCVWVRKTMRGMTGKWEICGGRWKRIRGVYVQVVCMRVVDLWLAMTDDRGVENVFTKRNMRMCVYVAGRCCLLVGRHGTAKDWGPTRTTCTGLVHRSCRP